ETCGVSSQHRPFRLFWKPEHSDLFHFESWIAPGTIAPENHPVGADSVDRFGDLSRIGHSRSLEDDVVVPLCHCDRLVDVEVAAHMPEHDDCVRCLLGPEGDRLWSGVRVVATMEQHWHS